MSKIKEHFQKHKTVYISAGTFVAGIGVTVLLGKYDIVTIKPKDLSVAGSQSVKIIGNRNTVSQVMVNVIEKSTPSKPLFDDKNGVIYNSISEASKKLGVSRKAITKLMDAGDLTALDVVGAK